MESKEVIRRLFSGTIMKMMHQGYQFLHMRADGVVSYEGPHPNMHTFDSFLLDDMFFSALGSAISFGTTNHYSREVVDGMIGKHAVLDDWGFIERAPAPKTMTQGFTGGMFLTKSHYNFSAFHHTPMRTHMFNARRLTTIPYSYREIVTYGYLTPNLKAERV